MTFFVTKGKIDKAMEYQGRSNAKEMQEDSPYLKF